MMGKDGIYDSGVDSFEVFVGGEMVARVATRPEAFRIYLREIDKIYERIDRQVAALSRGGIGGEG